MTKRTLKPPECEFQVFSPHTVRRMIFEIMGESVSERLISYIIATTIGETTFPSNGKGHLSWFSKEDIVFVLLGMNLKRLELPAYAVRTYIRELRMIWRTASEIPGPLFLIGEYRDNRHKVRFTRDFNDSSFQGKPMIVVDASGLIREMEEAVQETLRWMIQ